MSYETVKTGVFPLKQDRKVSFAFAQKDDKFDTKKLEQKNPVNDISTC